ncbi:MAG: caspase family protein [Hyphomonadaceae bacterium]|nr:caspase family protein [Hyphomonadaceae bacterium]
MRAVWALAIALACAPFAAAHAQDVGGVISREAGRQAGRINTTQTQNEAADRIIRPILRVANELRATALGADPTGRVAAIGLEGGALSIWDVARGREIQRSRLGFRNIAAAAAAQGGRLAIAGDADGRLSLLYLGRESALPPGPPATAIALTNDAALAAIGRADGSILLLTPLQGGQPRTTGVGERIAALGFTPDGAALRVLTASARLIAFPLTAPIPPTRTDLSVHGEIVSAAFAPDGRRALVSLRNGRVESIDLASGRAESTQGRAVGALAAGPQPGVFLAIGADGRVALAELRNGAEAARLISTPRGWAVMDHAGRYDGSNDALADIVWQAGPDAFNVQDFAERYFEPGVLGRYWRGEEGRLAPAAAITEGVGRPPKVELVISNETQRIPGQPFQVVVLATDMGAGVDNIRLYHNGRLVDRSAMVQTQNLQANGRNVRAIAFSTLPSGGMNTFRALASTSERIDGSSERAQVRFPEAAARGVQHVIVAGIDQYTGELPSLNFAVADARAVADYFRVAQMGGYSNRRVSALFNAQAAKQSVLGAIAAAAAASGVDDSILIYLAGHGFAVSRADWRFAPSGAIPDGPMLNATTISGAELEAALVGARARRVVVMIDACQSTAAFGAFVDQRELYRRFFNDLSRTTGLAVFTAARPDADAYELNQLGHGAFTFAMLQGLTGRADAAPPDGRVMVAELASYLESSVPALVLQHEGAQQEAGAFVLGADFDLR